MAKMYRHAPLNSIWEGSGNVMALDVLRAGKHIPLFMQEVGLCKGMNPHVDEYIRKLGNNLHTVLKEDEARGMKGVHAQLHARNLVDQMAVGLQASLLLRYGCPTVTELFIASRIRNLDGFNSGVNYGSTPFDPSASKHVIMDNMPVYV